MLFNRGFYFDADKGGAGNGAGQEQNQTNGEGNDQNQAQEESFDTWLAKQDPKVRSMYDQHVGGLKSALDTERNDRKNAEKQLRDLAKNAEKGSDAEKKFTEMADQLAEANAKAAFFEQASLPNVGIRNVNAAYKLALADGLIHGELIDFKKLQENYPELFGSGKPPEGNGGNGSDNNNFPQKGMNEYIRKAAGR